MGPHVRRSIINRPACLADDLQDLPNSAEPLNWHASATPCGTSPSQSGCLQPPLRTDKLVYLSNDLQNLPNSAGGVCDCPLGSTGQHASVGHSQLRLRLSLRIDRFACLGDDLQYLPNSAWALAILIEDRSGGWHASATTCRTRQTARVRLRLSLRTDRLACLGDDPPDLPNYAWAFATIIEDR